MKLRFSALLPVLLALAAPLGADDPHPGGDPTSEASPLEQHEDVIVSATRSERSAADVPVSATVVGRDEILQTPASTIDDLLRTVPGINLPPPSSSYIFPSQNTLSMRGTGPKRSLVLLDGAPLNDPFSGAIQWNKVLLPDLERVEIVRGGAAGLFGNQAMGGLVNIVPRRASENDLSADVSYGSYNTRNADVSVHSEVAPGLGLGATVGWFETDGFVREAPQDRGLVDIPSAARSFNGSIRADWDGAEGAEARFRASTYRQNISLGTPLSRVDRTISDVSAGGKIPTAGAGSLDLSGFFQHQILSYDNTAFFPGQGRNAEFRSNAHNDPIQAFGGAAFWSTAVSKALPLLAAGVDLQQNRGEDRATNFTSSGSVIQVVTAGGVQDFLGVFAESSLTPLTGLEILLNARLDFWRNHDGRLSASVDGTTDFQDRSERQFDPRLAVRYVILPGLAVRGAASRAFRAPFLRELYYGALAKTQLSLPNPDLAPEHSFGGEVGFDLGNDALGAQITVFRMEIDGLISQVLTQAQPIRVLQWFNVGNARSQGVETSVSWTPASRVAFKGSYSYTDSRVIESSLDPTLLGKFVPFVSRHTLSASLLVGLPGAASVTLRGRAQSRMYADAANKVALDPNAVFDLALNQPLGSGLTLTASCENLFDRRYVADVTVGRQLGDPREFRVGVRWNPSLPTRAANP